jgi:hypothetical protein
MSFEGLPLPVICLVLERIEGLTPERLVRLSSAFANRKWLRACREDVPWRAALRDMDGVCDVPKCGVYRWFVEEYMPLVAIAVRELHCSESSTCVWLGGNMYGEAITRLEVKETDVFDAEPSVCLCLNVGVGGNLQPGFQGMRSMMECLHPHCRARSVQVFSCSSRESGHYFSPQQTHTHWLQCCVCQRRFWFEETGYG